MRVSDLISRQDAIDAVYKAFCHAYCYNCDNNEKMWSDDDFTCDECHRKYQNWKASRKTVENTINALPSADLKKMVGCTGCEYYDQQQTAMICRECRRYYKDKHSEYGRWER